MSASNAKAVQIDSVEAARASFTGTCTGTVTLVATGSSDSFPFRQWVNGEWQVVNGLEQVDYNRARKQRGRLRDRAVKVLELGESGLTLSGIKYKPPAFLWNPQVEMRDCLRGHFDPNVHSFGRRPELHAVDELGSACVSILPSFSGGYMLTQEAIESSSRGGRSVVLCINKSVWRDRISLEPGMEIEVGNTAEPSEMCHISIVSISGDDRNLSRYSNANAAAPGSPARPTEFSLNSPSKQKKKGHKSKGSDPGATRKAVSFGESVLIDSGQRICTLDGAEDEQGVDMMTSSEIWSDNAADLSGAESKRISADQPGGAAAAPENPRIVLAYSVGAKSGTVEFAPVLPDLLAIPSASELSGSSPLLASYSRRKSALGMNRRKNMFFTIGGDRGCNIVLPNCPIKVVATLVAFENTFTLVTSHNLTEAFHKGTKLSRAQALFARHVAVHVVLHPERSFGLYDGDTIVFREAPPTPKHKAGNKGRSSKNKSASTGKEPSCEDASADAAAVAATRNGCCSGLEMSVCLFDPTEAYRVKNSKELAIGLGQKWDLNVSKATWFDRLGLSQSSESAVEALSAPREIEDLALELRAPVRISRWDGSREWRYGSTEAFALQGVTSGDEVSLGSSPLMTLSVKDPRMGRCHATIMRRAQKAFVISAAKASGKRALLCMVAASTPPGLEAASSPPHLLLAGEVFRVGASEFRVIGFTKATARKKSTAAPSKTTFRLASSGFATNDQLAKLRERHKDHPALSGREALDGVGQQVDSDEDGYGSSASESGGPFTKSRRSSKRQHEDPKSGSAGHLDFQALQEQAEEYMRNKIEKRGSIALVRHRPNEDEATVHSRSISTFVSEDNVELRVSNNVDKSFGFARVSEYKDVLGAFGLDEDTRPITYPGLDSFLIIQAIKGPLQRRLFLVNESECTIGSSPQCSVSVANDPLISPLHCRIVFNPVEQHWRLIDAHSRTGTFLRTTADDSPALLQPGQRYLLGNSQMRVLARVRAHKTRRSVLSRKMSAPTGLRRQIKSVFLSKGAAGPTLMNEQEVELLKRSNGLARTMEQTIDGSELRPPSRRFSSQSSKKAFSFRASQRKSTTQERGVLSIGADNVAFEDCVMKDLTTAYRDETDDEGPRDLSAEGSADKDSKGQSGAKSGGASPVASPASSKLVSDADDWAAEAPRPLGAAAPAHGGGCGCTVM